MKVASPKAMEFETVCVIGLGYIGLPTSAILATHGIAVIGVDVNPRVVDTINHGRIHIVEPELEAVVSGVVSLHSAISASFCRSRRPAGRAFAGMRLRLRRSCSKCGTGAGSAASRGVTGDCV